MNRLARWVGGVLAVLLTVSCAPSLRMVHRSRAYFERCYAADFDPRLRPTERHACWVAWLDHYTSGQPRERIMYARGRVAAQVGQEGALAMPGLPESAGSESMARAAHVLVPDAGPPDATSTDTTGHDGAIADTASADATPAPSRGPTIPPPPRPLAPHRGSPACAPVCDPRFVACVETCNPANPDACRDACSAEQRACGNACL